ncbi:hypothetical protein [Glutamicibacter ardleyensis]|uniref:hypothetical protein n=1 Tax=Glutamicibacter ardleyensis TaxID=225894 RepID=UPI003FD0E8D3
MSTATLIRTHAPASLPMDTPVHNIEYWKAMHLLRMGESTPRLLITAVNQYPCTQLLHAVITHDSTNSEVLERVVSAVEAQSMELSPTNTNVFQWVEVLEAVIANREVCTVELATKTRELIEKLES